MNTAIEDKIVQLNEGNRKYHQKGGVLIYLSKGGDHRKLNKLALDIEGKKIVCRHLVHLVLSMEEPMKGYHDKCDSVEKIEKIDSLRNNEFDKNRIIYSRQSYHYFPIKNFGEQLAGFARKLKAPVPKDDDTDEDSSIQESESHWYVCSEYHNMAVSIKRKSDNTVVVKFYNPNTTTSHVRALCRSIDDLSSLTLKDFIHKEWRYRSYFKDNKNMMFISSKEVGNHGPHVSINQAVNESSRLAFLLSFGLVNKLNQFLKLLMSEKDSTELHEILLAKREDGVPGSFIALQERHTQAVKAYIEAVINSRINNDQKVELLEAKRDDGVSGFFMALQAGHAEAVKAYCKAVIDSELDDVQKVELLKAKYDGASGLYIALENGHAEAVKAYCDAIINSELDDVQKVELLTAKRDDRPSGFYMALQEGHAEAVKAYCEAIINSELDDDPKVELLKAKYDGFLGLYVALANGHTEAVKTYCEAIINSELDDDQKVELLKAKYDGAPGLSIALYKGHTEAVKAYIEAVLNSNLPNDKKTELLAATDKGGNSLLPVTSEHGHTETVTAYIIGIINSELGDEVIQRLMDTKQDLRPITKGSQEEKMNALQRQINHFITVCTYWNSLKLNNYSPSSLASLKRVKDSLKENIKSNAITLLTNYISVRNTQNTICDIFPFLGPTKESKIRSAKTLINNLYGDKTDLLLTPDDIKTVKNKRLGKITQALVNAGIFRTLVPQQTNQNKPSRVLVI